MKTIDILKALPLLPASWLSSLLQQNKPLIQRQKRAEKWAKDLLKIVGYDLTVEGVENIPQDETIYFVSNHQGTLDPVLVLASCPVHVAFISKKENEKMPIFGRWARNIGTIHFDRNSREGNVYMLRESSRQLKNGHNLLIFPEGTRTKDGRLGKLKSGAFVIAGQAGADMVPCRIIYGTKDGRLHPFCRMRICFGEPIPASELQITDLRHQVKELRALRARLTAELERLYEENKFTDIPALPEPSAAPADKEAS